MAKKKAQKSVAKPAKKRVRKAKSLEVPVAEALPPQVAPPDLAPAVMEAVHGLPPAAESVTVTSAETVEPSCAKGLGCEECGTCSTWAEPDETNTAYHAEVIDSGSPIHARLIDCEEAEVAEQTPEPRPVRITHSGDAQPLPWQTIIAAVIAILVVLFFLAECSMSRGDVAVSVGSGAVSVDAGRTSVGIGWHPWRPPVPLWKPEPWRKPVPPAPSQHRRPHHRHGGPKR